MLKQEDIQTLISAYFTQKDVFVKHHLESYNEFLNVIVPSILNQYFPMTVKATDANNLVQELQLRIVSSVYEHPHYTEKNGCRKIMSPTVARTNNHTYSISLYVNFEVHMKVKQDDTIVDLPFTQIKDVLFGKFPIPVKSEYCVSKNDPINECRYDQGGYFIVNGNEKILVTQEKVIPNIVQVHDLKGSRYGYQAEIRSSEENIFAPPKTLVCKIESKATSPMIVVMIPHSKKEFPVSLLFKALGCLTDKDIIEYVICHSRNETLRHRLAQLLLPTLLQTTDIHTEYLALENISSYLQNYSQSFNVDMKIRYCKTIIQRECLPHLGDDIKKKAHFLGWMVYKMLLCKLGISKPTDRDNYQNKRMETTGSLMGTLTSQCVNRMCKDIRNYLSKEINSGSWTLQNNHTEILTSTNINKVIKGSYIESVLKGALATGNWGMKTNTNKQGVSQVLNRLTFMSTLSHTRRISMPVDSTGKLVDPRKLHNTQFGYICPSETPEGQPIGVVKNFACSCEVTLHSNSTLLRNMIRDMIHVLSECELYNPIHPASVKVVVNGDWIGYAIDPYNLVNQIRKWRRTIQINPHTSVTWDISEGAIYIFTDRGRCIRPLIIKDIDKLTNTNIDEKTWSEILMEEQIIEYIDSHESDSVFISPSLNRIQDKSYTHCEIHPSLMLGVMANCIPFSNHNQSPRNTYQSAMGKQAIGIHCTNMSNRYDSFSHMLHYPQRPLVNTRMMNHFKFNELPNGINVIVAIATYGGYNQEDSVLVNQAAIDRGLFSSTMFRCYKDEAKKNQLTGEEDIFCKPDPDTLLFPKPCDYSKLSSSGIVPKNTKVTSKDIIIGKVTPVKNKEYKYRDGSISVKTNESGYIDDNYDSTTSDGYKFCKVRVRRVKIPEIGDKVSSRHGQKGTIGMIYPQCDMPTTADGIVPDIIMNPHAVPSRMTIAQLIECILGKSCAKLGCMGDGTPFENTDVREIGKVLESCGHEGYGNQVLYSGITGEQLKTQIFMGPTYYQRLKHMSGDKVHSRASGPVVSMTRQPAEGRSSHGGLRFGEMERDCMISHGASFFLKERMLDVSDKYTIYTCNECNMIVPGNPKKTLYECKRCKNYGDFSKSYIPYSCKLLLQELNTMSIGPRLVKG
uniref:DNA-directed RNA polymerase n=1 Tax=viral metagenome TaxID=1070528 RepID=A0A6C0F6D9_9ZZZZ|tara:strand:+ start:2242 stop:5634 length:3393 start_codon:yes stop_codon:yes gene_type:complete